MARLIIPDDFTSQLTLLNNIIAQNTALGAASPLAAFLTQQDIVLANDAATGTAAQTRDTARSLLKKQAKTIASSATIILVRPGRTSRAAFSFSKPFIKVILRSWATGASPLPTAAK